MISATVRKNPYIRNPYIVGRPIFEPELFFGRREKFDFIEDNLRQDAQVILFHGQRRIGKSSVLKQIPNFVGQDDFVFVQFDLHDKPQLSLSRVLYSLGQAIIKQLQLGSVQSKLLTVRELETNPTLFADSFLQKVYQELGDKKLVLLLDEFDVLSSDNPASTKESSVNTFFPYLQSLLKQEKRLFIIPFIGRQLDDMPKLLGLFKGAPNQEIGLLSQRSARELITEPAKGSLTYKSEAIDAILALTSGHPYFTQVICNALFAQARTEQKWQVTRDDVTTIVDDAIEISELGLTWFGNGLPIPERVIFSAVAEAQKKAQINPNQVVQEPLSLLEEYGVTITESLTQAREKLVESGFLGVVDITNQVTPYTVQSYKVKVELVRRWLVQRYPLRREIFELENLEPEAKANYKKAIKQTAQGDVSHRVKPYEQVLKANPNHFSALFEIARIYLEGHKFDQAVKCYQRAYLVAPDLNRDELVESLLGYGKHLMEVGKVILATRQFEQVLRIDPDNKVVYQQIYNDLKNPFIVGKPVPPERFVGRTALIETAFEQISARSNLSVWGGPGIGKSSFLQLLTWPEIWRLNQTDPSQAVIVLLNCLSIHPFTGSGFWGKVLSLIKTKLDSNPGLQADIDRLVPDQKATAEDFRKVLGKLGAHNKFLVLLADDYDAVFFTHETYTEADMEAFLKECRSLAYLAEERQYLSMILTSSRRLNELGPSLTPGQSPWYNHYLFRPLKPFTKNEVDTLLQAMPITPALRDGITEIADGHPSLLQNAGYLLYQKLRGRGDLDPVTFAQEFQNTTLHIFQQMWELSNPIEQTLLMLIALSELKGRLRNQRYDISNIDNIFSQQEPELNALVGQGVIKSQYTEDKINYSFASSIMEWWVVKKIQNTNETELEQRKKVFLNVMSSKQAEQVTKAIRWLWNNKDQVPSILEWIGKVIAAFPQGGIWR